MSMDEVHFWASLSALAALAGVIAYALLAGADFGGGVWDLVAAGPRKKQQRLAVQAAMGPVWEANHVWLIFVLVVLFTCFPRGYAALAIALFVPFHLALLGIMLRGASFVFRSYQSRQKEAAAETSAWGIVFGVASIISPLLLGVAFGVVTQGGIRVEQGDVILPGHARWLSPYCVGNGLLALSACAYLAAVYLTNETEGELREDFRQRAIFAGTATAILAGVVVVLAWMEARWFFDRLLSLRTLPVVVAGVACFAGSAWSVFTRRYWLSRAFAAGEISLLILGWGLAQYPYLVYPDLALDSVAAPVATLRFVVLSLPVGAALIIPSLWLLLRVFKSRLALQQRQPNAK
jgi:cytochrome d ubiquinol oxidase subunit II